MPKFLLNRWYGYHVIFTFLFNILLIGILSFIHWGLGLTGIFILTGLAYFTFRSEKKFSQDLTNYIATISYRVKKAGAEVIQQMPIGIVLYNEDKKIEWHSPYVGLITGDENLIGKELAEVIPELKLKDNVKETELQYKSRIYHVDIRHKERLLYFTDITEYVHLLDRYENEKPVFGIIHLDNLDEVGQGMDDLSRSLLLTDVSSAINDWANDLGIYLRRYTSDKFFMITNQLVLDQLENSRFDILDIVREMTAENIIPLTLSLGIGAGADTFIELGQMAQSSLDIALGRGGDQAAVKIGNRLSFYGGKSNAVEKRTRVRARVISHALRDLIRESDSVFIMGHKSPDMDALGASIGVLKAVRVNGKKGFVILDEPNPMVKPLLEEIAKHKELPQYFISSEKALNMITPKTLLVIVDTHRPSMVIEPKLVENISRVVVIDHHRRSEEFVKDPVLFYIEPYASSASELVTELLQYQTDKLVLDPLEATSILAGIVIDTKSFTYRTGYRTFEAASFLRTRGADPILIQTLLKEDIKNYILKAEIVKKAKIVYDHIAIATVEDELEQIFIAQAADTLLNMKEVLASFVISMRTDGLVSISARSLGKINVQIAMERLGGGGHLTNAAVQLEGVTVKEAEAKLMEILEKIKQEGGLTK